MPISEHDALMTAQAAALKTVVVALVDLYGDKPRLKAVLEKLTDHMMGQWLNSTDVPDGFVAEYQRQMEEFQARIQST